MMSVLIAYWNFPQTHCPLQYVLCNSMIYHGANMQCTFAVLRKVKKSSSIRFQISPKSDQQFLCPNASSENLLKIHPQPFNNSGNKHIIIIIIKNECHNNIIVDRLQGCGHSKKLREGESESRSSKVV